MPDITLLRLWLADYAAVLRVNLQQVREAHTELEHAYRALREVYSGEGAREFDHAWSRAGDAVFAYVEGVPALLALLEEKTEQLGQLDQGF